MLQAAMTRASDNPPVAWIIEDNSKDRQRLSSALGAIGLQAESIKTIGNLTVALQTPGTAAPELIVIDANWRLQADNLEALTGSTKTVAANDVGLEVGRHIRTLEQYDGSTLVLTSTHEEPIRNGVGTLSRAVAVHKNELYDLKAKQGETAAEALVRVGIYIAPPRHVTSLKLLTHIAKTLGLEASAVHMIAGGWPSGEALASDLLAMSRDADARVDVLESIVLLLRDKYGKPLPSLDIMSADLGTPLRAIVTDGSFIDLLRLKGDLEARAGGRVGR
jgi:CheY-like chemotaxis protein